MEGKKTRGRQAGQTKAVTVIKDPLLGKYHIENSESSFDVIQEGKNQPIAHCTDFGRALFKIAKCHIVDSQKTLTIKEYVNELKTIQESFSAIGS